MPNLNCYCSTASTTGYTLGEGSVQCIASSCGVSTSTDVLERIYRVCEKQRGALPNTHATLTATSSPTTASSTAPSSVTNFELVTAQDFDPTDPATPFPTPSSTGSTRTETQSSPASSSTRFSTLSALPTPSQSTSPSKESSQSQPTSDKASAAPVPVLTRGQIIGIAAAGVLSATLTVAVIIFCGYLRRRRQMKQQGEALPPTPSIPPQATLAVGGALAAKNKDGVGMPLPANPKAHKGKGRWTLWHKVHRPDGTAIPIALDSKDFQHTPMTQHTAVTDRSGARRSRRTSMLLPDKPVLQYATPAVVVGAARHWSDATHIDDERMSVGTNSSCRTSVEWAATHPHQGAPPNPLGLLYAHAEQQHLTELPGSLPPAALAVVRPLDVRKKSTRTNRSSMYSSNRSIAPSIQLRNGPTPRNTLMRYSAASATSFESLGGEVAEEGTAMLPVSRGNPVAGRRDTRFNYPPVPRSASGRALMPGARF
ncbi:MAG: hypothetical protein M1832_003956 [Thelocarpon impressellum]|nr:MAG: hypothetical protein M1832_003956 [Thelocarpon impressellum]